MVTSSDTWGKCLVGWMRGKDAEEVAVARGGEGDARIAKNRGVERRPRQRTGSAPVMTSPAIHPAAGSVNVRCMKSDAMVRESGGFLPRDHAEDDRAHRDVHRRDDEDRHQNRARHGSARDHESPRRCCTPGCSRRSCTSREPRPRRGGPPGQRPSRRRAAENRTPAPARIEQADDDHPSDGDESRPRASRQPNARSTRCPATAPPWRQRTPSRQWRCVAPATSCVHANCR